MISSRAKFHKVYDLAQNVLPKEINTSSPTKEEYIRFIIIKYIKANALANAIQITYLLKNTKKLVTNTLKNMYENKELIQIKVDDSIYYTLPSILEMNINSNQQDVKILSPFDNLLIQRRRMVELFDFDYLLECYVPREKRKYGYFCLPILFKDKLIVRMDCKVDRKESILNINNLVLEEDFKDLDKFAQALKKELLNFMKFNNCTNYIIHKTEPTKFRSAILKSDF
jgi:uncharacterized protein YcaQ